MTKGYYKDVSAVSVPVIMYHSVGLEDENWLWRHLSMPLNLFESQVRLLAEKGFKSVSLSGLYGYMRYKKELPENPVVLTFDDGYLDNWVYAYPILKKYGMRAAIFVNPEFVDPSELCRPNLDDVWNGKCADRNLTYKGFLSWPEMRQMEKEGVMEIQSHSMSHTWYFCSDVIVDFHCPGNNNYPWMFWNSRPDKKYNYLNENQEVFVPYGSPIYENGRSLGVRRYFEDKRLTDHLANFVRKKGLDMFRSNHWRNILLDQVEQFKRGNKLQDRFETNEEQDERFRYELIECKNILEDKLNKKVQFLCWAGGAFNKSALTIATEAGYLASTLYYNKAGRKNMFGEDSGEINRTGCVSEFNWRNRFISFTSPGHFLANIKYFQGDRKYFWIIRFYKMIYLMKYYLGKFVNRGEL